MTFSARGRSFGGSKGFGGKSSKIQTHIIHNYRLYCCTIQLNGTIDSYDLVIQCITGSCIIVLLQMMMVNKEEVVGLVKEMVVVVDEVSEDTR